MKNQKIWIANILHRIAYWLSDTPPYCLIKGYKRETYNGSDNFILAFRVDNIQTFNVNMEVSKIIQKQLGEAEVSAMVRYKLSEKLANNLMNKIKFV